MADSPRITSRQNQRVKDAVQLRTSRGRREQGRFIIDGTREIARALAAGIQSVEAFVCDALCHSPAAHAALDKLRAAGAELLPVTTDVHAKLCFGEREDEGIIVIARTPARALARLQLPSAPFVAVMEGVEKPGNLGAILRTADAAGVDAVIVADGRTDLFNPNVIRASLGTVFRASVVEATTAATVDWLRAHQIRTLAARPNADALYTTADMRGGVAIALGSEAAGLSDSWNAAENKAIRIPMHGLADSLNVSTTAAVLFYEALRQRSDQPT